MRWPDPAGQLSAAARGPIRAARRRWRAQDGSQSLELVMVLPIVLLLMLATFGVGWLGVASIHTQALSLQLARLAAVADDHEVMAAAAMAGITTADPGTAVDIQPPSGQRSAGTLVTVHIQRSVVVPGLGWFSGTLSGRGAARTEEPR